MKKYIPILLVAAMGCSAVQLSAGLFSEVYEKENLQDALVKKTGLKKKADKKEIELGKLRAKLKTDKFKNSVKIFIDEIKREMGKANGNFLEPTVLKKVGLTTGDELARWGVALSIERHDSEIKMITLEEAIIKSLINLEDKEKAMEKTLTRAMTKVEKATRQAATTRTKQKEKGKAVYMTEQEAVKHHK
jgi:hypothetical protein